jgi:hypothetical protein
MSEYTDYYIRAYRRILEEAAELIIDLRHQLDISEKTRIAGNEELIRQRDNLQIDLASLRRCYDGQNELGNRIMKERDDAIERSKIDQHNVAQFSTAYYDAQRKLDALTSDYNRALGANDFLRSEIKRLEEKKSGCQHQFTKGYSFRCPECGESIF